MAEDGVKWIYLIRHGESTFNAWRKKSLRNFSWIWIRDPHIRDAPLTSYGKTQALTLSSHIHQQDLHSKIQVVIKRKQRKD